MGPSKFFRLFLDLGPSLIGSRMIRMTRQATVILLMLGNILPCLSVGCSPFQKRSSFTDLDSARKLSFEGMRKSQAGEWQAAEEDFRLAVEACPEDERAHALLADALWNRGKSTEALEEQQQAVKRSGGDPKQHVRLGEMLLGMGYLDQAMGQAEVALEESRQLVPAWNLKGETLQSQEKLDEALHCYQRSLSIDNRQEIILEKVAEIYERLGRPQRALATWYAVEELYPEDAIPAAVLYREALAMQRLDRDHRAVELLVEARHRDPDSPEVVIALSDLQRKLGDHINAGLTADYGKNRWPDHPGISRIASNRQNAPATSGEATTFR